jgi:hypothetical protein
MSTDEKKEMVAPEQPEQPTEREQALARKQAAQQLADYKKRLKEGIELKRMQVEELELNIKYFNVRKEWRDLQPAIQEMEAKDQAEIQEMREKMSKGGTEQLSSEDKKKLKGDDKIEIAKVGEPRK